MDQILLAKFLSILKLTPDNTTKIHINNIEAKRCPIIQQLIRLHKATENYLYRVARFTLNEYGETLNTLESIHRNSIRAQLPNKIRLDHGFS